MSMSVFALALAAGAATAQADVVASLSYQTLTGSFTSTGATTGTFTANATTAGQASAGNSTGNVTREPAGGNAAFFPGFSGVAPAAFSLSLSVTGITGTGASASGLFTATDVLGNTIAGSITGTWIFSNQPGIQLAFFDGLLSNVNYTAVNGNLFTGNSGAANMAGIGSNLPGGLQITFLQSVPPSIFSVDIPVVSTVVQAQITPTPGALALVGLGGLAAARRRR